MMVLDHRLIRGRQNALNRVAHRSKSEWVDFYTKSRNVLLLEFAGEVAFHKGGLLEVRQK